MRSSGWILYAFERCFELGIKVGDLCTQCRAKLARTAVAAALLRHICKRRSGCARALDMACLQCPHAGIDTARIIDGVRAGLRVAYRTARHQQQYDVITLEIAAI